MDLMNFGLGVLGFPMEPQCFDPFSLGCMFVLALFASFVWLFVAIISGAVGLTTALFTLGHHTVTLEDILILAVAFVVCKWIIVPWYDKHFTSHLHPPDD
jgi:hypothetical protein